MKHTGKKLLSLLLAVLMLVGLAVPTGILAPTAKADVGQTPDHHKSVSSNEDGTYTIELTVTGDADTEVETAANVNVIIVYDVSQSMTNDAPNSNRSRADNAEDVVHKFIDGLAKYQSGDGSNIEVALVTFGPNATIRQQWTSDLSTETGINQYFDLDVDGNVTAAHNYGSNLGTNWEHALIQAQSLLTTLDNRTTPDTDPTFVIFVTDGVCTKSGTASGNGESPTNTRWSHYTQYYTAASDNAFAIEQRADTTLFGIYAYGTEADLLDDLVYYANTPNEAGTAGTHRTMTVDGRTRSITDIPDSGNDYRTYTFGNTITETTNYFNATNTDALNSAIQSIFTTIVEALGVSSVEIKDGTTNEVKVGTETVELLEVDESSYKYWLSIPIVNNEFQRVDLVSGETITYTVSDDGKTVSWPTGNFVEVNGTIANGYLKYQWTEANALYNKEPPGAKLVDGEVQWDLSSLNALLDGVIYSVTFTCYPSQTTLDYVADIKNDPYVDDEHPGAWGDLPAAVQKYIGTDGSLITNTNTNLHWVDTREDDPEGHDEAFTDKIDPVENDAIEQLTVSKDWKNLLATSDWNHPDKIDLVVTRDNDPCYTVTLSNDNDWASKVFISVGIMGADGQPLDGAAGHDFAFTEPETEEGFKWQINAPTVHPMLIENKVKMLIKVDEKHLLPNNIDDEDVYEFEDYKGILSTYYVDEETVSLTATNERRSSINVVKTVEGVDIPEDATFPFTITVIDSLAPKTPPATDTNHESDYWLWFSIRDKDGQGVDNGVENAISDGGGYWYAPSGTSVTISAKAGYSIRLMNLPTGSTYTIVEGDLPTGFTYDNTTIALTQGEGVWKYELDRTTSGSVDTTNAVYTITYTNKYELVDINVDKVWDDNNNQDGKRPTDLTLTLGGLPSGTTAPTPTVTKSEDGNTWTYVWKGLPRYDTNGSEITNNYTVTEGTVPEGYTCETKTVGDGGTITNVHTPEETTFTVTKNWDDSDDIGDIRPANITVQLFADGEASGDPVTLTADKQWTYTWEKLPKYAAGELIVYSADETAVPTGYTKQAPTTGENSVTITNTYSPTPTTVSFPVQKVLSIPEGLTGPETWSFTFNVAAADGAPAPTSTTANVSDTGDTATFTFAADAFKAPGTYTYTVTENGELDGVTNDGAATTGKTVTVTVTDNKDGTLIAEASSTEKNPLAFTNTYGATGSVELEVTKAIEGAAWPSGKKLTINLTGSDGAPMPETTTVELTAADTAKFPAITYDEDDVGKKYTYTISEGDGFGKGWTGSGDVTATVEISDKGDGSLNITVTYTPTDKTITNTYKATGEAVLEVTKELAGANWPEGKTLTFTLSGSGGTLPRTTTVDLTSAGSAKFDAITYTEADIDKTYTYTISEGDGFGEGWTGSGDITATVKVTDNGDGTLTTDITYSADDTIINTYVAEGTAVLQAKKVLEGRDWLDGESFTFTLKDADGKTIETKTVTKASTTVTFTAIEYDEEDVGKTFTYTIAETSELPFHVTKSADITATVKVTDNGNGTLKAEVTYSPEDFTITNTYDDEKTTIKVTKVWDDNSNQDGKRPDSVKFTVTGSDKNTYEATLKGEGDTWTAEVEVSKYTPDGKEVTFEVDEETVSNYSDKEIDNDTLTITNSYTPGKITLTVTKIWNDNGDQDGKRPDKVNFTVTGSDKKIYEVELSGEGDKWTAEIKNVDQYMNGGEEVTFTVKEEAVDGYEAEIDNKTLTITNTHTADTIEVSGKKTWDDANNQDGLRPDSITVNLLANGTKVDSKTVTAADDWTYTFTNLPKNDNGNTITYSITEEAVEGYTTKVNGYDITNTYNPEEQTVTVNKIWDDNENQDGVRPSSVTVTLKQGDTVCDTQTLSESNGWEYTWEGLPKKSGGKDLTYTVEEDTDSLGDLYEAQEPEVSGSIFTITNKHVPEVLDPVKVTKVWNDDNNKTGKRPSSVTVTLLADGKSVATATLTEANGWTYTFENLPKYEKGKEIKYTLKEATVSGYTSAVTGNTTDGFTVTNTVKDDTPPSPPPVIRIEIVKVWEDDSNASGTRTETVEVTLLKGGVKNLTRNLGDSNEWKYEGYVEAGYDYKVVETPVEGYESIVTQSPIPGGIRFTVVNKLTKTPELNTKDHVAYIVGYPDGTVRPGKEITRAEVATIFFRLLTEEARDKYWSQTNPYPDVKLDDWFNNAISTLTNMGIINGYEDGTFRPNNPITRAELTKMAVSFFSSADQYFGKTPSFSDVPADAWYTRFIAAAEALGLINGYPDGTFRPTNYITRAETCTIVNRTLGRGPHKDHLLPYAEMINWPDNTPDAWYYAQIQEASNSHDYDWITEQIENTTVEQWLAKLPERDWVALEQIWSNSHSAPGGEVMG